MNWAKINDLKAGDKIRADAGFGCIDDGAVLEVKEDKDGLYVECKTGAHYLGDVIAIGFYKEEG